MIQYHVYISGKYQSSCWTGSVSCQLVLACCRKPGSIDFLIFRLIAINKIMLMLVIPSLIILYALNWFMSWFNWDHMSLALLLQSIQGILSPMFWSLYGSIIMWMIACVLVLASITIIDLFLCILLYVCHECFLSTLLIFSIPGSYLIFATVMDWIRVQLQFWYDPNCWKHDPKFHH